MIDINYSLAYYTTNVNIYEFHWQSYGHAVWYDSRIESYEQAIERVKYAVWEKIYNDNPHLRGTKVVFSDGDMLPVIDYSKQ